MSFISDGRAYPDGALFPSTEKRYPVYTLASFERERLARLERERAETANNPVPQLPADNGSDASSRCGQPKSG